MTLIPTRDPQFFLRFATPDDAGEVVRFMKLLGTYQKMAEKITATELDIRQLLTRPRMHCLANAKAMVYAGIEMEALTPEQVVLRNIYDLRKTVDREKTISTVKLSRRHGEYSGSRIANTGTNYHA